MKQSKFSEAQNAFILLQTAKVTRCGSVPQA